MANLQFQSFSNENFEFPGDTAGGGGAYSGRLGDSAGFNEEGSDQTATAGSRKNIFSFAFYQQFFDVDTDQVAKRILNSVIPTHRNYITEFIQPLPDLYGPFWVCVTLVFSIGIFSNIAQYIENRGLEGDYGSDFRMVTGASTLIASYVIIVPFILSSLCWYRKSDIQYSYVELLSAYGYSLSIFIPVSMLWTIDSNWWRWLLIFGSVALSGGVLMRALAPAFQNDPNKLVPLVVILMVGLLQLFLAICFKEYFFDPASGVVSRDENSGHVGALIPGDKLPLPHVDPTQSYGKILANEVKADVRDKTATIEVLRSERNSTDMEDAVNGSTDATS